MLTAALATLLAASPSPAALLQARPYAVEVPSTYNGKARVPLLVTLPGFCTEAFEVDEYLHLAHLAFARGWLVVRVQGLKNSDGNPFFNATDACCDFFGQKPDDVAYLDAVLEQVAARYRVDPRRVFLAGLSNGGFLAYRYACERSRKVAGLLSVGGAGWTDPGRCKPEAPVAVLEVHGDADATIQPDGGTLGDEATRERWAKGGIHVPPPPTVGPYPSVSVTVEPWRVRNGCGARTETLAGALDLDTKLPGAETSVRRWPDCSGGTLEVWWLHGGKHVPDFDSEWGVKALDFLAAHPRP